MSNIDRLIEYIEQREWRPLWELHREYFGDYIVWTYAFLLNRIREKRITRMIFDMSEGYRSYRDGEEVERYATPIGSPVRKDSDKTTSQQRFKREGVLSYFYEGLLKVVEIDDVVKQFIKLNRINDETFEVIIDYFD